MDAYDDEPASGEQESQIVHTTSITPENFDNPESSDPESAIQAPSITPLPIGGRSERCNPMWEQTISVLDTLL